MDKYISRMFKIRYVPCSKKQHGFKNNDGRNKNTNIYLKKITAIIDKSNNMQTLGAGKKIRWAIK